MGASLLPLMTNYANITPYNQQEALAARTNLTQQQDANAQQENQLLQQQTQAAQLANQNTILDQREKQAAADLWKQFQGQQSSGQVPASQNTPNQTPNQAAPNYSQDQLVPTAIGVPSNTAALMQPASQNNSTTSSPVTPAATLNKVSSPSGNSMDGYMDLLSKSPDIRPSYVFGTQQAIMNHQKDLATLTKAQQDARDKNNELGIQAANELFALPQSKRADAYADKRRWLLANGFTGSDLPVDYDKAGGDQWLESVREGLMNQATADTWAKGLPELTQKASANWYATASQIDNPQDYAKLLDNPRLTPAYIQDRVPRTYDQAAIQRFGQSNLPLNEQPTYQKNMREQVAQDLSGIKTQDQLDTYTTNHPGVPLPKTVDEIPGFLGTAVPIEKQPEFIKNQLITQAMVNEQKNPGSGASQIDDILAKTDPDLAGALKTSYNAFIKAGDPRGAAEQVAAAATYKRNIAEATNPDKIKGEVNKAVAIERATSPLKVAQQVSAARALRAGDNPALAKVPPSLTSKVVADATKLDSDYLTAKTATDTLGSLIDLIEKGNKAAGSNLPVVGVDTINAINGIKRKTAAEMGQYEQAGSAWDNLVGKLGKITAGNPWPQDVLDDVRSMHQTIANQAWNKYTAGLKNLNARTGSEYGPTQSAPDIRKKPKALEDNSGATHRYDPKTGTVVEINQ